ncbi:MAG TPA: DUF6600 domain-containing protein [Polyangiaceae bacterium]|jgi:hypothetical protein
MDSLPAIPRASVLVAVLACFACEPLDEGAPAASPPALSITAEEAPATAPPGPAPAESAADAEGRDAARYASDEVTIGQATDGYEDDDPSALTDFRATLDPHGAWEDDPIYGTVWVPSSKEVGADFQPYVTAGHWAYDSDWVWVSDYDWGWAPFHYGRWVYVQGRGWAWIPGRAYRGAWVSWGVDDGYTYLGWAPLGPAFLWFGGVPMGFAGYYTAPWVYCPRGYVFAPAMRGHLIAGTSAGTVAGRARPFVPAHPSVGGPSPQNLGYRADQVPSARGAEAAELSRAQSFARPSSAQTLGGRPPTTWPSAARPTKVPTVVAPRAVLPGRVPAVGATRSLPATAPSPVAGNGGGAFPAPAVRSAPRVGPASPSPRVLRGPSIRGGGVHVR